MSHNRQFLHKIIVCCSLAAVLVCGFSCRPAARPSYQPTGKMIPSGELIDDQIRFQFAIYFLPEPKIPPLDELTQQLSSRFPEMQLIDSAEEKPSQKTVLAKYETNPKEAYPPPTVEVLQFSGRGISPDQEKALQHTGSALILTFAHPKDRIWDGLENATELTLTLTQSLGGLIWDNETREMFSPEEWERRRMETWTDTIPDVSTHTVIHVYQKGELDRGITLGMLKLGLPDVVVEQMSRSNRRTVGHIINLFAQAMAEGAVITKPGEFDLDIRAIKNSDVRERQVANLLDRATGVAQLSLREGIHEAGDPRNRLIEITFERGMGPDPNAMQDDILSKAFGFTDSVSQIQHNEEIHLASQRAKQQLPLLRTAFEKGLAPNEIMLVKAPFQTPSGGNEWMWVEITSWQGDKIRGLLQNEPSDVPGLKAGQAVNVSEADVFDYIRQYPDGRMEGNETAKLIEKLSK